MRDLRILAAQTHYALLTALRTRRTVAFSVVFPVVLLVLYNSIFTRSGRQTTTFSGGAIDVKAYFTAAMIAYAIMVQAFTAICISVTTQRESGQLKRLRGTPMPRWTFMVAQALRALVLVGLMTIAMLALGRFAYGVDLNAATLAGVAVYAVLGGIALATLGLAITAFTPTVDAASTLGPFSAVILAFISGVFISVDALPHWLASIGKLFPLYYLADGLQRALARGPSTGITERNVAALALWGAIGLVMAARRFRWEPQAARG